MVRVHQKKFDRGNGFLTTQEADRSDDLTATPTSQCRAEEITHMSRHSYICTQPSPSWLLATKFLASSGAYPYASFGSTGLAKPEDTQSDGYNTSLLVLVVAAVTESAGLNADGIAWPWNEKPRGGCSSGRHQAKGERGINISGVTNTRKRARRITATP